VFSNVVDFSVWSNYGASPTTSSTTLTYDITVVNVLNLTSWSANDLGRSFRIIDLAPSAALKNALFVVNASIDMSNSTL
jgi:hypothetical protein